MCATAAVCVCGAGTFDAEPVGPGNGAFTPGTIESIEIEIAAVAAAAVPRDQSTHTHADTARPVHYCGGTVLENCEAASVGNKFNNK